MHPKAAYLALHGFVPTRFSFLPTWVGDKFKPAPTEAEWRIKRQLRDMEPQLMHGFIAERQDWVVSNSSELKHYTEVTWSSVPDEVLDSIPQGLIEKFVSTC